MAWVTPSIDDLVSSRGLRSHYVFYKRLETDNGGQFKSVYEAMTARLDELAVQVRITNVTSYLRSIAANETEKERRALVEGFGLKDRNLKALDIYDNPKQTGKILINAYNTLLNYKTIYERNLKNLQETNNKTVVGYFGDYFYGVWNGFGAKSKYQNQQVSGFPNGKELFYSLIKNLKPTNKNFEEKFNIAITQAINETIQVTLKIVLTEAEAETEGGKNNAYVKFYKELMSNPVELNSLTNAIKEDIISEKFKKAVHSFIQEGKKGVGKATAAGVNKRLTKRGAFSGKVAEVIDMHIANTVLSQLSKQKGFSYKAIHSGPANNKPDIVYTVGLPDIMNKKVEEVVTTSYGGKGGKREQAIAAMAELQKDFSEIGSGFLIYVNQKEAVRSGFYFNNGGFSSGSAISVNNFSSAMASGMSGGQEFIGGLLQVANGAIGEEKKEEFENSLASQIAYFLFDDFSTIGNITQGPQSIHLLLLDGVYIPMSVVYTALALAVEKYKSGEGLVKATITAPAILYPTQEDQYADPEEYHWEKQRDSALESTTIKVNFLKEIKQLIKEFMG